MENGPNDASTSARYGDVERRLLRTLISSVSTSNDFRTALQTTLRAVCEETGWDYGEAWIPSVAGDVLECSQQCHAPAPELASYRESSRHVVFPPDVGLPGRVWTSKEPEWIPDVSALPKTRFLRVDIAREVGLKAAVGVPIVADKQVLAVLAFFMFESRDEDGWALEMVSVAATELGALLRRVQAEERNRWHQNTQAMINALLHLSLETLTLTETLDRALRLIVSLPWLKIESRGSVSLVEDESDTLTLAAQCGLAQELCELCRSVPFGTCHCGRAAASGQTVFTGHLDESHEIHHQGMTPHGHYCVPIMFDGHVRGVLNTYVEEGHTHEKAEQAALEAAADVLASVIERKRTVEALAVNRASFLSAMRTAGDTLVIVDQKGVITALDPSELSPEQPDQDGIQRNHHPALPGTVADAGPATEILESVAAGYRVIRMLGSGTTGFVFLVEKDNRQFAMKVLREHGDRRESVARMKRFFREAEILSNIEHPAVVRIHQLGFSTKGKQAPYLLMEYVSGHPLTRYIAGDNLTLAQKLSVIGQITDALVAVHGQHILHRDI
ncbi:MAG: GAF domain-containing protein, partial [Lentisphaerae bacterium]|nr:GAF domain-containing protein [Lentisphaerota bacterium]